MSEKRVHQIDSKNEWLLLSVAFTAKLKLVFVLTFENTFSGSFHFKANRKSISSSKRGTRDFQNSPPFERLTCFYVTMIESSNVFNTLTLKQIFWKMKIFFKKLGYHFLVKATKIDNKSSPFKTALLEANVKTNRMATTKWTYHKEWSFASNYFIFVENLFQF